MSYLDWAIKLSLFAIADAVFFMLIYWFHVPQLYSSTVRAMLVTWIFPPILAVALSTSVATTTPTVEPTLVLLSLCVIVIVNAILLYKNRQSAQFRPPSFFSGGLRLWTHLLLLPCLEEVFYRHAMVGVLGHVYGVTLSALWFTLNHSPFQCARLARGFAYSLMYAGGGHRALFYCCFLHVINNLFAASFTQKAAKSLLCRSCSQTIAPGSTYYECANCTFNVSFFCPDCVENGSTLHKFSHRLVSQINCKSVDVLPRTNETLGVMIEGAFALYGHRMLFENQSYRQVWALVQRRVKQLQASSLRGQLMLVDSTQTRAKFWIDLIACLVCDRVAVPGRPDTTPIAHESFSRDTDAAMIVFSSGTTGRKKGAIWTHQICLHVVEESFGDLDRLVVMDFQPLDHAFTLRQFTRVIYRGGQLFLAPQDISDLASEFQRARATVVGATPAFYRAVRAMGMTGTQFFGNRVKIFLVGGAPVSDELLQWIKTLRADALVIDGYSTTESSAVAHPDNTVKLLEDGEIVVSGPTVISSYWNNECPERFVRIAGKQYFCTGDYGRFVNGALQIIGRKAFAFKLAQGEFVQPEEIESIIESHAAVSEAIVWGDSHWSFVLCIVVRGNDKEESAGVSVEDIQQMCHHRASWEIPQAIVWADYFPHTASGKKDRRQILDDWKTTMEKVHNSIRVRGSGAFNEALRSATPHLNGSDRSKSFVACGGDSISALALAKLLDVTALDVLKAPSLLALERLSVAKRQPIRQQTTSTVAIDWVAECSPIPLDTFVEDDDWKSKRLDRSILLLGATGFMGPFLLKELAKIYDCVYCIVRGSADRVDASKVVIPLVGDVSLERFGLDSATYEMLAVKCCAVFNNAAWVNGLMRYQDLKETNVGGAVRTLKFAAYKSPKHITFVSSVNVLRGKKSETPLQLDECLPLFDKMPGYAQTKMVSELVLSSSVAAADTAAITGLTIFRPATVSGCTHDGTSNIHCFTNGVIGALASLSTLPAPLLATLPKQLLLTPVDWVCRRMAELHRNPGVFHLVTPSPVKLCTVVESLQENGFSLPEHSDSLEIPQDNPLYVFKPALEQGRGFPLSKNKPMDSSVSSDCPVVDRQLMSKYLRWLMENSDLFPDKEVLRDRADPQFRIERWYPSLKQFTPETKFIKLSGNEVSAMLEWSRSSRQAETTSSEQTKGKSFTFRIEDAGVTITGRSESTWVLEDEAKPELGPMPAQLAALAARVKGCIDSLGGRAFIRMSDRSPKDVDQLSLCCTDAQSALQLLALSRRIQHDLRSTAYGSFQIAVRRFDERIADSCEVRMFVVDRLLSAATQYHKDREFSWNFDVKARLHAIWTAVAPHIAAQRCTVDVALLPDGQFILIELNHGPPIADMVFLESGDLACRDFVFKHK